MIESMSPRRALLLGALTVGVLDILDAFVFFGFRGVPPLRILQAIASGVVGREAAVTGGLATAALGLVLHFFIAFIDRAGVLPGEPEGADPDPVPTGHRRAVRDRGVLHHDPGGGPVVGHPRRARACRRCRWW